MGLFAAVFWNSLSESERGTVASVECNRAKVCCFRIRFLEPRFLFIRHHDDSFCGVYYRVYRCLWSIVLWMGLSTDHFYGNGIQKTRVFN